MEPAEVERPLTERELVALEARLRAVLAAPRAAPPEAVRRDAVDALRLLRRVQRDHRFVAHLVRLAGEHDLLPGERGGRSTFPEIG
jgi:hypothetical protein